MINYGLVALNKLEDIEIAKSNFAQNYFCEVLNAFYGYKKKYTINTKNQKLFFCVQGTTSCKFIVRVNGKISYYSSNKKLTCFNIVISNKSDVEFEFLTQSNFDVILSVLGNYNLVKTSTILPVVLNNNVGIVSLENGNTNLFEGADANELLTNYEQGNYTQFTGELVGVFDNQILTKTNSSIVVNGYTILDTSNNFKCLLKINNINYVLKLISGKIVAETLDSGSQIEVVNMATSSSLKQVSLALNSHNMLIVTDMEDVSYIVLCKFTNNKIYLDSLNVYKLGKGNVNFALNNSDQTIDFCIENSDYCTYSKIRYQGDFGNVSKVISKKFYSANFAVNYLNNSIVCYNNSLVVNND